MPVVATAIAVAIVTAGRTAKTRLGAACIAVVASRVAGPPRLASAAMPRATGSRSAQRRAVTPPKSNVAVATAIAELAGALTSAAPPQAMATAPATAGAALWRAHTGPGGRGTPTGCIAAVGDE